MVVDGEWPHAPRAIALGVRRGRIFAHSFARSHLLVRSLWEVVDAFYWGSGDVIEYCASMLDRIGALIGEQRSSRYCEGVPLVVVFEILPSHVKTFHYRPQRSQLLPGPIARCATSLRWLWVRPRFVAVTTYRCRVRFRRPDLLINN